MDLPTATVINLPRRPDRRAAIQARWDRLATDVALKVHPAVDGHATLPGDAPWWALRRPGIYGCYHSHRQVLAVSDGPLLVLEDDAVFAPGFTAAIAALDPPDDWDVIYLGGEHKRPPWPHSPGLVRPRRILRSHAYIARRPHALAAMLARAHYQHIDWLLARMPISRYAVSPFVVGQDGSASDVTSTVHAENFWNG